MSENIIRGASIGGISACVPSTSVNNAEYGGTLYKDIEAVIGVTGVEKRRCVPPESSVTSLDLCVRAASALRDYAGFDYSEFGGLIFVTMTPDFLMPNNASYAHKLLGFSEDIPAFDLSMACSGYPYGLWIAGLAAASTRRSVLLLDGDTHSPFISPEDKSTALLFGDGGTATVVKPSDGGEWRFSFVTVGDRESLVVPDGGYRNRVNADSLKYTEYPDGSRRRGIDLKMDGMAVFNAVLRNAPRSLSSLMEADGRCSEDYDLLLLHQANLMMINQVAKKLKFSGERFPSSIGKYGNIGSGSIPLTICSELSGSVETKKSRVLMSAFGAGFSVGSASVEIGPCPCAGVVEYEV
ncbi:MAG: ketoacyl-ACP synthase III [Synergistaceae bacterium]|jgi:3-oxoacyl-[acyl-carrier-protein] synthase-3|nr:ketoacyl-ACP synthase III [Synergistaceae bacterium]